MKTLESLVAEKLLKIKAVKLQPFVASLNWSWLV